MESSGLNEYPISLSSSTAGTNENLSLSEEGEAGQVPSHPISISQSDTEAGSESGEESIRMYIDSENESSDMSIDENPVPPPGWWKTYYFFGDFMLSHKYIVKEYAKPLIDKDGFIGNVFKMIKNVQKRYGNTLKAMYLLIRTLDQEGNTETIEIRFDVSEILRTHFIDDLKEFVEEGIAPLYVNLDTSIQSDSVTGRVVEYLISKVRFLVQKEPLSHMHVTRIIGGKIIHPGWCVKAIFSSDHEVLYG